ncbi:hypothetical protein V9T40_011927 [Parthenolecanium corni]|uniref:Uncharacterized protein n=1 Tax=Parthenolecanium corni TaxID=536013 RepID=A0AAN9XYL7_9HEMI
MQTTADWYADKEIAFTFFSRVYGRHQPLTNAQPEKDYGTACSTTRATTPIFAFGWDRRGEHHSWCTDCDGRGDDRRWSTPNSIIPNVSLIEKRSLTSSIEADVDKQLLNIPHISFVRTLPGNLTFKLLANYYQELFPVTFLLAPEQTNCLPGKASEQLPGIFRPVLAQDYQSW